MQINDEATTPPEAPAAQAYLEVLSGSRRDEVLPIAIPGTYTIGSQPDCDVTFDRQHEPFVSGQHAELRLRPDHAEIIDLDSSNGTFLDGHRVTASESIYCGDIIELGLDGPRLRFDTRDTHYVRTTVGRSTVVIHRPEPAALPPPAEAPKKKTFPLPLLIGSVLVLGMIGLLLFQTVIMQSDIDRAAQSGGSLDREIAAKYSPGVFLIALRVVRDGFYDHGQHIPKGRLLPLGTAWAFDTSGRLATNSHMIQAAREKLRQYESYVEMVLVQNGTKRVYLPQTIRIHPQSDLDDMRKIGFDVAVIELNEPVSVAFPLATETEIREMSAGESIYTIGFPIENVGQMESLYGYDSPEQVVATLRQGIIQRITNGDGQEGSIEQRRMVHLDLTTAGGQSGSPIFTRDGTVVAILSATAVARIGRSSMPHPGRYTYSARIDSLLDMINDTKATGEPIQQMAEQPKPLLPPLPSDIDFSKLTPPAE